METALGLLVMAAVTVNVGISQQTGRVVTADEVIRGGGEGTCSWQIGPFGQCSQTCDGVQTREVFCQCILHELELKATHDNCLRDDLPDEPLTTGSCGTKCAPGT